MKGILVDQPEALEERCGAFFQMLAWPAADMLNWRGWLANFSNEELRFARCLLEAFCYFGPSQSSALLRSAFHGISREVVKNALTGADAQEQWQAFLSDVIVTHVEGEDPSPADSSFAFTRGARESLGIPEARIVFVHKALEIALDNPGRPIVFVDDCAGSGQQMEKTWNRKRRESHYRAFEDAKPTNVWYAPLIATWKASKHLAERVPSLRLRPAHLLSEEFSAWSDHSLIWPEGTHSEAKKFLLAVSRRAGYEEAEALGFHDLALCLAINDTIPDFSLPVFFSRRNGWIPLMRRADPTNE